MVCPEPTVATIKEDGAGGAGDGELRLVIWTGETVLTAPLKGQKEFVVGRSHAADIYIDHPSISRRHVVLRTSPGLAIKDEGSLNGTRVRGSALAANTVVPLAVGDLIEIGSVTLVVRRVPRQVRLRRIWAHGYFEARLEEESARAASTAGQFAIVRISVPASAEATEVDAALAEVTRPQDICAQYAPHEYELLLVDTTPPEADEDAGRIAGVLAGRLRCGRDDVRTAVSCYPRDGTTAHGLLERACASVRGELAGRWGVKDTGSAMAKLKSTIEQVARSDLSVLILGETGVGKEVCAEAIHALSARAGGKLLRLNCAALTETLLESELFGHERGAFSGATSTKPGLLETADGGTVFLDEIGDLPLALQVKLLRVLEDRRVQRVGGLEPRVIDVRFIAATHRDLEAEIEAHRFRQDLYYRLNGFSIEIPPLRERVEEIAPLARHFAAQARGQAGFAQSAITQEALALLQGYAWPGNIRELRNIVERAVVLAGDDAISVSHLPAEKIRSTIVRTPALAPVSPRHLLAPPAPTGLEAEVTAPRGQLALQASIEDIERRAILDALAHTAGNQTQAAKMLGMSRSKLLARLDAFGIPRPRKKT
jgi:DNA-binding NtrC family response regulator